LDKCLNSLNEIVKGVSASFEKFIRLEDIYEMSANEEKQS